MTKRIGILAGYWALILSGLCLAQQQEEKVTITTYYPSPSGIYNRLLTQTIGVGDTNADGSFNINDAPDPAANPGNAWIAGNVSIGTSISSAKLRVDTNVTIDGIALIKNPHWLKIMSGTVEDGSYNAIVRANDTALIYTNGTQGTGALVIAPWAAVTVTSGMRIDGNGNVGIGTSSPGANLTVLDPNAGSGVKIAEFLSPLAADGNTNYIRVGRSATGDGAAFGYMFNSLSNVAGGFIGDSSGNPRLFVNGLGNVGIGTSTPLSKLHLANNVAAYPLDDFQEYQMLLYQGATPANSYGLGIAPSVMWFNTNGDIVFTRQGTETARITNGNILAQGYLMGNAGGAGGRLNDRGGDNRFSVDWSGSPLTLKFYIEDVNVKNFIIDNPLDPSKYLIHTTLEGPENAVFYRGEARLDKGVVEIVLPEYFEALTREESRTVLLTPVFQGADEKCSSLAASRVKDGRFSVKAIDRNNPQQSFYWEVKAVRKDVPVLFVQPDKDEVDVYGQGPYKYYRLKNSN